MELILNCLLGRLRLSNKWPIFNNNASLLNNYQQVGSSGHALLITEIYKERESHVFTDHTTFYLSYINSRGPMQIIVN